MQCVNGLILNGDYAAGKNITLLKLQLFISKNNWRVNSKGRRQ